MMNDKMVMAIAKAVGKEVEIKTAEQDGKNIIVTAVAGDETYKAVFSERVRNILQSDEFRGR